MNEWLKEETESAQRSVNWIRAVKADPEAAHAAEDHLLKKQTNVVINALRGGKSSDEIIHYIQVVQQTYDVDFPRWMA